MLNWVTGLSGSVGHTPNLKEFGNKRCLITLE